MPNTGYDPFGPFVSGNPVDLSGGGADSSYAWSLAPGGRFPGDEWAWQEYQRALEAGTAGGDPNYDPSRLAEWLAGRNSLFGMLARGHIANQSGGPGQEPSLPGGYPWQFWSGPGAPYGPSTGPTRGLVDQGRPPGQEWDMPEWRPPSAEETGTGKKKGGKGGKANFTFTPVAGIQQQGRFVDWQPIEPGTRSTEPTRFVPGLGSSTPRPAPQATPPGGKQPKPGRGGGNQSGGGGGRGQGGNQGGGGGQRPRQSGGGGGRPATGGGGSGDPFPIRPPGGLSVGGSIRDNTYGGVDAGNVDFRTPGWRGDPSTGIFNTSGFPNPTPPAQGRFETPTQYAERLHDLGYGTDDIMSMTGPWAGWGTGSPVMGPNGLIFANQAPSGEMTMSPFGRQGEGMFTRGPATSGGAGGGGTRGAGDLASAAGWYHGLYY